MAIEQASRKRRSVVAGSCCGQQVSGGWDPRAREISFGDALAMQGRPGQYVGGRNYGRWSQSDNWCPRIDPER